MNDDKRTPDDFEARLRALMRATTDGLEPKTEVDALVPASGGGSGPRPWARLAAGSLVAAALVGAIVWTTQLDGASKVNGPQSSGSVIDGVSVPLTDASLDPTTAPSITAAAASAQNFLVVGTDNGACVDPSSPTSGGFGDRSALGERSDTMMVIRVDPATDSAAMLSFPRDLWVPIAGGREGRLNSAFVRDDPQKLIDTIFENFAIPIDHFVQVDLCGFKAIVDAVGGVSLPFDQPVRDVHTGLAIPQPGCFTFDGDHALAYARSRHYEYLDEAGVWQQDPTSDLGRIARQQELARAVLDAALGLGIGDVNTAQDLVEAVSDHVVVDNGLTISMMLEYFGVLARVEPADVLGFQIAVQPRTIAGNAVLEPSIDSPHMRAVLDAFQGKSPMPAGSEATLIPAPSLPPNAASAGTIVDSVVVPAVSC